MNLQVSQSNSLSMFEFNVLKACLCLVAYGNLGGGFLGRIQVFRNKIGMNRCFEDMPNTCPRSFRRLQIEVGFPNGVNHKRAYAEILTRSHHFLRLPKPLSIIRALAPLEAVLPLYFKPYFLKLPLPPLCRGLKVF